MMGTYRKEWDCCGSVTETEAWKPEHCPFCTDDAAPLRKDAERWRKLRDTPATSVAPGPMRGWLFSRPGGADSLDRMADALPAVGAA
jgi:hypothetical protein